MHCRNYSADYEDYLISWKFERMDPAEDKIVIAQGVETDSDYQAYLKLKIPSGEDKDFKINKGPGHLLVLNKKTGRGFYVDFD